MKEFLSTSKPYAIALPARRTNRHVTVLLATYNGAKFLQEQLASIANQDHGDWSLIASDDGSTDGTIDILRGFAARHRDNRIVVLRGPAKGAAQNFLSLLRAAGAAPCVAFADQDDIWFPTKLSRAIEALADTQGPALYCARTRIIENDEITTRTSPLHRRPPGFGNALIQNIAGGNTMVINRPALNLLQRTSPHAEGIVAHDWWCYQMITGAGGQVIYDPEPCLYYRQHAGNLIGANDTLRAGIKRFRGVLDGRWRANISAQAHALTAAEHWLTEDARQTLRAVDALRQGRSFQRPAILRRSGLYHQRGRGALALWAAALVGRL